MAGLEDQIDALYQLPPGEFTAARAELAKTLKGAAASAVKALKKPTAVPWAVNQLYWRDRRAWQRALETGRSLRAAQVAAIEGRKADVRQATDAHRSAVVGAAAAAVKLAAASGITIKPEPVAQMLEAVSLARTAPEHPGRFTEVLHPAAFEALLGVVPRGHTGDTRAAKTRDHDARDERKREEEGRARRRTLEAAVKKAEHDAERAHEEASRARQALTKADAAAREAQEALESARAELDALDAP